MCLFYFASKLFLLHKGGSPIFSAEVILDFISPENR